MARDPVIGEAPPPKRKAITRGSTASGAPA